MQETFVLVDVESDGPVPGRHSMLSFAAVAFNPDRTILGTFSRNLETLPGATQYEPTMKWWQRFPEAWAAGRENAVKPEVAMPEFAAWLRALPNQPVIFAAAPSSYDWMFTIWYLHAFSDVVHSPSAPSPFHVFTLDIFSFAYALIDRPFREIKTAVFPKAWKNHKIRHSHCALDDAMGHAMTFCAMLEAARAKKEEPPCDA